MNWLQSHSSFHGVSYAELCSEHCNDLPRDECTQLNSSGFRDDITAVPSIRRQEVQSPVNSLEKQDCAISHASCMNLIHLVGCDVGGASGDQLGMCCHHITCNQRNSLPNITQVFTSKRTNDSRLEQVAAYSDDTAAPCYDCSDVHQHKPLATSSNKKATDMHGLSSLHQMNLSVLDTIEEEEAVEEGLALNWSADTCISVCEHEHGDGNSNSYMMLPHNVHTQERRTRGSVPSHLQLECHVEDLGQASEISGLLERIMHYQTEYEELREFTHNEKKMCEEFFSIQLSEADSKIQALADENELLKCELKASRDECEALCNALNLLEQSKSRDDNSDKSEPPRMDVTLLKQQLSESEMRRNDCEMRLELVEKNFRNQTVELTQYLEDTWNELASSEQLNVGALYTGDANDVTRCEEPNDDGLPTEVAELEKEMTTLRASLKKQTYEFHKLKKHLCHESKLVAKISDFERELSTLKQENSKLFKKLREKIAELNDTHSTISLLREEKHLMENENVKLSRTVEIRSKEIQSLKSRVLNVEQETDVLWRETVTVSGGVEEKCEETEEPTSENSKQKKENSELNDETVNNKLGCTHKNIAELLLKKLRLKEEVCSMNNNSLFRSNTLEANILGLKQLSENSTSWEKACSLKSGNASIAELCMHEAKNSGLKVEVSSFNCNLISESTKEKTTALQTSVNKNVTLKTVGEKGSKEMAVKVKRHNSGKSLMKNISRLSNDLKERVIEKNQLKSELEEEKLTAENLEREALVHQQENIKLSKMLNHKMQDAHFRIADTQSEVLFKLNNISITENANFSKVVGQKHKKPVGHTLKTEVLSPDRTWTWMNPHRRVKAWSECTNQMMKVNWQQWKLNCLQKKVAWQKKILNKIQKRELQLKTSLEWYKSQEEILHCLKQENTLQKHRILLLELQANHVDFVHKIRMNYLQSLIASLRHKNMMLRSHLYHLQSNMKNSAVQCKATKKCGQSISRDIGVQTLFSSSDSMFDFGHTVQSDCNVIQACGLSNVHIKTHNYDNQISFAPYGRKHHPGETNMLHDIYVHIQGKTVRKAQEQSKFFTLNLVEKNIPKDSSEIQPRKNIQNQHVGQRCYADEGAEGWSRLGREFDLQLNTGAYY